MADMQHKAKRSYGRDNPIIQWCDNLEETVNKLSSNVNLIMQALGSEHSEEEDIQSDQADQCENASTCVAASESAKAEAIISKELPSIPKKRDGSVKPNTTPQNDKQNQWGKAVKELSQKESAQKHVSTKADSSAKAEPSTKADLKQLKEPSPQDEAKQQATLSFSSVVKASKDKKEQAIAEDVSQKSFNTIADEVLLSRMLSKNSKEMRQISKKYRALVEGRRQ